MIALGATAITRGVQAWVERNGEEALSALITRHSLGDWGDLESVDWAINKQALYNGGRIMSSYEMEDETIWIITESDRSRTTALLPSEY